MRFSWTEKANAQSTFFFFFFASLSAVGYLWEEFGSDCLCLTVINMLALQLGVSAISYVRRDLHILNFQEGTRSNPPSQNRQDNPSTPRILILVVELAFIGFAIYSICQPHPAREFPAPIHQNNHDQLQCLVLLGLLGRLLPIFGPRIALSAKFIPPSYISAEGSLTLSSIGIRLVPKF